MDDKETKKYELLYLHSLPYGYRSMYFFFLVQYGRNFAWLFRSTKWWFKTIFLFDIPLGLGTIFSLEISILFLWHYWFFQNFWSLQIRKISINKNITHKLEVFWISNNVVIGPRSQKLRSIIRVLSETFQHKIKNT